LIVSWKSY